MQAILARQRAETLSSVLYPDDRTYQGKELRLKQQHFFVSATMQVCSLPCSRAPCCARPCCRVHGVIHRRHLWADTQAEHGARQNQNRLRVR